MSNTNFIVSSEVSRKIEEEALKIENSEGILTSADEISNNIKTLEISLRNASLLFSENDFKYYLPGVGNSFDPFDFSVFPGKFGSRKYYKTCNLRHFVKLNTLDGFFYKKDDSLNTSYVRRDFIPIQLESSFLSFGDYKAKNYGRVLLTKRIFYGVQSAGYISNGDPYYLGGIEEDESFLYITHTFLKKRPLIETELKDRIFVYPYIVEFLEKYRLFLEGKKVSFNNENDPWERFIDSSILIDEIFTSARDYGAHLANKLDEIHSPSWLNQFQSK